MMRKSMKFRVRMLGFKFCFGCLYFVCFWKSNFIVFYFFFYEMGILIVIVKIKRVNVFKGFRRVFGIWKVCVSVCYYYFFLFEIFYIEL